MNITDIMFHVHPELSSEQRTNIEEEVGGCDGVISIHFSKEHLHELTAAKISSQQLLDGVREWDEAATMIGL